MAHVGVQFFASQSEKFYSEINEAYILVGSRTQTYKFVAQSEIGRLLGVRRPGAALLPIIIDQGQSGARPPHSKEAPIDVA